VSRISLNDMSQLARHLADAERTTEEAEEALKKAKAKEATLREETIPNAMFELELKELKLSTGEKISIKQDVFASIPEDKKQFCYDWLKENGFGGIIKFVVGVAFGKAPDDEEGRKAHEEKIEKLIEGLIEQGHEPEISESVHAQTMAAFLREQIATGNPDFPLDLFGARPIWKAKVTQPKI
jgi:hypothetical protein